MRGRRFIAGQRLDALLDVAKLGAKIEQGITEVDVQQPGVRRILIAGVVKLIDEINGVLAENGADLIHEAVLAVKYRLTIDDIIDTVHVFPTMTESIKLVATSFRKDIDELSCCAE